MERKPSDWMAEDSDDDEWENAPDEEDYFASAFDTHEESDETDPLHSLDVKAYLFEFFRAQSVRPGFAKIYESLTGVEQNHLKQLLVN